MIKFINLLSRLVFISVKFLKYFEETASVSSDS